MELLEAPLFRMKDYFASNLATFVTAINTETADKNRITDMREIEVGRFSALAATKFPVMNIIPDITPIEPIAQGYDEMQMTPVIYIADRVHDTEASYLKLLRYAQAVRDSLVEDSTAGSAFDWITVSEIRPYPADANNIAIVVVRCTTNLAVSRA